MARLIFAIVTTILEEIVIIALVLIGLPALGVHVPLPVLYVLVTGWAAVSIVIYRLGTWALERKAAPGLPSLNGCDGLAVTALAPEGTVRVNGETWSARSVGGMVKGGEAIEVVGREDMKLLVRRCQTSKKTEVREVAQLSRAGSFRVDEGEDQ
ncbi:MAG: hypothetical protein HYX85_00785 [Chloroflexi bacterium]|nr:hypothetical protein [Chloroflexota bacterium]